MHRSPWRGATRAGSASRGSRGRSTSTPTGAPRCNRRCRWRMLAGDGLALRRRRRARRDPRRGRRRPRRRASARTPLPARPRARARRARRRCRARGGVRALGTPRRAAVPALARVPRPRAAHPARAHARRARAAARRRRARDPAGRDGAARDAARAAPRRRGRRAARLPARHLRVGAARERARAAERRGARGHRRRRAHRRERQRPPPARHRRPPRRRDAAARAPRRRRARPPLACARVACGDRSPAAAGADAGHRPPLLHALLPAAPGARPGRSGRPRRRRPRLGEGRHLPRRRRHVLDHGRPAGPRRLERFLRAFPGVAPWRAPGVSTPIGGAEGPVRAMGELSNRLRRFVDAEGPLAPGFVAIGDAAYHSNPVYGRGCPMALVQAVLLDEAIARHRDDLVAAACYLDRESEAQLRPYWDAAVSADRRAVGRSPGGGARAPLAAIAGAAEQAFGWFFDRGVLPAARIDPVVFRGLLRTFHMLERPERALLDPELLARSLPVLARVLGGRGPAPTFPYVRRATAVARLDRG